VTSNYAARRAGVTKLMGVDAARQACPGLVLVSGEDLMPYRQASRRVLAVLQRFGTAQKAGLDEVPRPAPAPSPPRRRPALQGRAAGVHAVQPHAAGFRRRPHARRSSLDAIPPPEPLAV